MNKYSITYQKETRRVLRVEDKEEGFALNYERSYPYPKEGDIRYFNLLAPDQSIDLEVQFFNFSEKFADETRGWNSADYVKRQKSEGCSRISVSLNSKVTKNETIEKIVYLLLCYDESSISSLGIKYRIINFNGTQRVKTYE
ncbi:MAG: hypothetical protein AAGC81_15295 [Pseudomonadota bacterium]